MSGSNQILFYLVDILLITSLVWLLILRRNLKQKELSYSRLVNSIGEGIGIVDDNEVFIFANKAAENILETGRGKLKGRSLLDFLSSRDRQKIKEKTLDRKKKKNERYELKIITAKGNTKVVDVTASPNFNDSGKFISTYGVFRDITDFKNAQIKLKESEKLFKTLLNNVPLPIFHKDTDGKYTGCNETFEKFIGKKVNEFIGKSVFDIAPSDVARVYSKKDDELLASGKKQIYEWKYIKSDGEVRNVVFHKAAISDDFGNITGLIGVIIDITDVRKYEKSLVNQQNELERSNRDLEEFAYTVSHDLQEPLRMVGAFMELLKTKHADSLNTEAQKYINFAVEGAGNMQSMIQGLLSYSRISTRGAPFKNISLKDIIESAKKNLSQLIKDSSAQIKYFDVPVVTGDRSQLVSVFQNLIENAIKYKKEGTVPKIDIACSDTEESNKTEIIIRDNGIGMDKRHLKNIFIIFHRLHPQSKYEGTGMGLAIVKKIIERHGGYIVAESKKEEGSIFKFTLNKAKK